MNLLVQRNTKRQVVLQLMHWLGFERGSNFQTLGSLTEETSKFYSCSRYHSLESQCMHTPLGVPYKLHMVLFHSAAIHEVFSTKTIPDYTLIFMANCGVTPILQFALGNAWGLWLKNIKVSLLFQATVFVQRANGFGWVWGFSHWVHHEARAFYGVTSKIPPLDSMLNFDADVKKMTARRPMCKPFFLQATFSSNVMFFFTVARTWTPLQVSSHLTPSRTPHTHIHVHTSKHTKVHFEKVMDFQTGHSPHWNRPLPRWPRPWSPGGIHVPRGHTHIQHTQDNLSHGGFQVS